MKCVDIRRNTGGESGSLDRNRRSGAKARVANGIRYPGSPSRKRWVLGRGDTYGLLYRSKCVKYPAWGVRSQE